MQNSLWKWELAGVFFIIICGVLLHFVFAWSGSWRPLALIAAVNESTWEHLKLAFWPTLFWGMLEYIWLGKKLPNLLVAKTISLYLIPILILLLVNFYTALTEDNILVLDIFIFCLAIIIGQWISYRFLIQYPFHSLVNYICLSLLIIIIGVFSMFTYYPFDLPLFTDPGSGQTGIIYSFAGYASKVG